MLFYLPEILPASQPWFTLVQPMDLNSIISLKSLLWHPVFCEGRGPYRSSQSICLLFIIRLVSVKEGTVFLLLSAFYFRKHIACLLAHSRCSIFIQCVKDRKFCKASTFHLSQHFGSLCIFVDSVLFFLLLMCTLYSRHDLRHEDISINIGSCFPGTHTSDFYNSGFF